MGNPSKSWIKLWLEILYDPKMGKMSDRLFRRTIQLFLLAGEVGNAGGLPSLEDMAWKLRTTPEQLAAELDELNDLGILTQDIEREQWVVTNFTKRQKRIAAAERMQQYRARKKQDTDPEIDPDNTDPDQYVTRVTFYRNEIVTNRNERVTNRNKPRDNKHAAEMVLDLQERWLDLTGGSLPSDETPRVNDYFLPLNRLLIRVGWDGDAAFELLREQRLAMLADGKTPYRPAAIVPRIMGGLDIIDEPQPEPADVVDQRFARIMDTYEQTEV